MLKGFLLTPVDIFDYLNGKSGCGNRKSLADDPDDSSGCARSFLLSAQTEVDVSHKV